MQAPVGLCAHSTGLATSWALFRGVSIQELFCEHFYKLGVTALSLAHAGLGVGSSGEAGLWWPVFQLS